MHIRVEGMSKSFKEQNAQITLFKGVSMLFKQGYRYAIMGPSGSGKTTFMHILAGITQPTEGLVFFNNDNLNALSVVAKEQFLNKHVGLLFQNPYLIKELTVLENVMLKGLIAQKDFAACKKEGFELLEAVMLQDKAYEKPTLLSGGQQQRVALARALFGKPAFLLADEPTGDLDQETGQAMIELMVYFQKEWDMGIIVNTHDVFVADAMQIVYELKNGEFKVKREEVSPK